MTARFPLLVALSGMLLAVVSPAVSQADENSGDAAAVHKWAQTFQEKVRPIFAARCNSCHGNNDPQAELNLAKYGRNRNVVDDITLWEALAERVRAGEMPPEGSPPLSDEQKKLLLDWADSTPRPDDCRQLATDETQRFYRGYVMSRRITRYEYDNCVRDLTGLDLKLGRTFPSDGAGGEGFDTVGDALFSSPILLERYLEAADKIIETALPDNTEGLSTEVAAARARLLIAEPSDQLAPRDAARQVVKALTDRAYRRPVEEEEIERLLSLFDAKQEQGDSYLASLRYMLKAVLISPQFLFLAEPEPEEEGVFRLGPYELATRISFFLWSSLPDDELRSLAASGEIYEPEVLKAQVRRMLKDPRSRALGENFTIQWLNLTELGTGRRPDSDIFPEFDEELAAAMREELVTFAHTIFRDDRPLREFLHADYTFLNERLAKLYGIEGVTGEEFQRVSLTDGRRGGVLTMASVLTTTSYPNRTSIVLRGRWVLEDVLGSRVPPPPPGVPALPEEHDASEKLTFRERFERHRSDPTCAACHARMDPLGFGLENFDAIGRWRDQDAGLAIDASGKLPSGETFAGPEEMKQVLLKRKGELLRNLTRKMLGYALGRGLNRFDDCVIRDSLEALKQNDDRASVLVEQIVLSYPFQHRYFKK